MVAYTCMINNTTEKKFNTVQSVLSKQLWDNQNVRA